MVDDICGDTIRLEDVPWNVPRLWRGEHEVCRFNERSFLMKERWRCRDSDSSCSVRRGSGCAGSVFLFMCGSYRCYKVNDCCD